MKRRSREDEEAQPGQTKLVKKQDMYNAGRNQNMHNAVWEHQDMHGAAVTEQGVCNAASDSLDTSNTGWSKQDIRRAESIHAVADDGKQDGATPASVGAQHHTVSREGQSTITAFSNKLARSQYTTAPINTPAGPSAGTSHTSLSTPGTSLPEFQGFFKRFARPRSVNASRLNPPTALSDGLLGMDSSSPLDTTDPPAALSNGLLGMDTSSPLHTTDPNDGGSISPSQYSSRAVGLLDLPYELRFRIYEFAYYEERQVKIKHRSDWEWENARRRDLALIGPLRSAAHVPTTPPSAFWRDMTVSRSYFREAVDVWMTGTTFCFRHDQDFDKFIGTGHPIEQQLLDRVISIVARIPFHICPRKDLGPLMPRLRHLTLDFTCYEWERHRIGPVYQNYEDDDLQRHPTLRPILSLRGLEDVRISWQVPLPWIFVPQVGVKWADFKEQTERLIQRMIKQPHDPYLLEGWLKPLMPEPEPALTPSSPSHMDQEFSGAAVQQSDAFAVQNVEVPEPQRALTSSSPSHMDQELDGAAVQQSGASASKDDKVPATKADPGRVYRTRRYTREQAILAQTGQVSIAGAVTSSAQLSTRAN
ncbi:Hypothetical predicted protein [Lecanosticta acicola]|uniref:Uncharacterized protein n=1 Tax=Lecanosticta acicola TaxID=111012 RepID=A0AAI8Z5M3_9PEZI|nr:Hypothetical predicted protein [Lecanosticta acicola]